jgi:SAM-dependent methyltransferase
MRKMLIEISRRTGMMEPTYRVYEFLKTLKPPTLYRNMQFRIRGDASGIPTPPAKLIMLVVGHADIQGFLGEGSQAVETITTILKKHGIDINNFQRILDFGCGCGRVIRHWHSLRNTAVFGTDYNPQLIEWCKRYLKFAQFGTNELLPPLRYESGSFDFLYALSVFTHLPEDAQHQWIEELSRILEPGGYLLITTHGEFYLNVLTQRERMEFEAGNLVVRYQEVAGTNMCSTFQSEGNVRRTLTHGFEMIDFVPKIHQGQDVYLLKKTAS